MPAKVLSIENARSWSWGLSMHQLVSNLSDYEFVHIIGRRRMKVYKHCECSKMIELIIDPLPVADDLIKHFDITMLQNVESLTLVRSNKEKVVCRLGGMIVDEQNDGNRYNEQLAQVGAIIATNQQLCDIGKSCNENTFLVPNGCDLEHFCPADPNPNLGRQFTMGFAGNVWGLGMQYKGYQFYVKAMTVLITQVKSKTVLHAHNQIDHEDMPEQFYHQIDCLVLPTMGEGCSNVVMEALACGVPVLITKVGYHGEMLKDMKNCIFIERDANDIEKKILMLKGNPALRIELAENGREFAEKHHDIKDVAQKYDEIFRLILKE